jgi:polar amino acid transport system permease protein
VLAAVLASFTEELLWAGLGAIARGQYEAARSTGLTFLQMMRYVVLPQAFRLILAPLTSRIIATTKNTALASVVAVPELLSQANAAQGYSGNASPLTVASIGYLVILLPMVIVARWLERARKLA